MYYNDFAYYEEETFVPTFNRGPIPKEGRLVKRQSTITTYIWSADDYDDDAFPANFEHDD